MKRKHITLLVLALMAVLILAGCAQNGAGAATTTQKPQLATEEIEIDQPAQSDTEQATASTQAASMTATGENLPSTIEGNQPSTTEENQTSAEETMTTDQLTLYINDTRLDVVWEDNRSVAELAELVADGPLEIAMSMYGGFEQVGSIGRSLPRDDAQTTTSAGDIVLYSGDQIVIFYGSNSWTYTRLGQVQGMSAGELEELLGREDVLLKLEAE